MLGPLKALFRNNDPTIKVIDKVWMSAAAKSNACVAMVRANPACVFICWFPETYQQLQAVIDADQLVLAERAAAASFQDKIIVFAEHHPLNSREVALYKMLNLTEVPVLSSLDEPLFMRFGGERTLELMQKLGMREDEVIGSNLITKALRRAQQKIEEQVTVERDAHSQREWFNLNLPPK